MMMTTTCNNFTIRIPQLRNTLSSPSFRALTDRHSCMFFFLILSSFICIQVCQRTKSIEAILALVMDNRGLARQDKWVARDKGYAPGKSETGGREEGESISGLIGVN
jgi:hypothetical protein